MPYKHVILISVDDLRFDALSSEPTKLFLREQGLEKLPRTPELDDLALKGVRFSGCRSTATLTPPSHATILTGLIPPRHGVRSFLFTPLPRGVKTLFERLRAANFETLASIDYQPSFTVNDLTRGAKLVSKRSDRDTVEAFARSAATGKRTFLFWHLADCHSPYGFNNDPASLARNKPLIERFLRLAREHGAKVSAAAGKRVIAGQESPIALWNLLLDQLRKTGKAPDLVMRLYLEGVNAFDAGRFRNIVKMLKAVPQIADTLVVLTSDHGEAPVNEGRVQGPIMLGHGESLREAALRVPLIFWTPSARLVPASFDFPVSTADIAPTILSACAVRVDKRQFDGTDRSSLLAGKGRAPALRPSPCYAESWSYGKMADFIGRSIHFLSGGTSLAPPPNFFDCLALRRQSIRRQQYKLVKNCASGKAAVFDVERDPLEKRPLNGPARLEASLARQLARLAPRSSTKRPKARARKSSRTDIAALEASLIRTGYLTSDGERS